MTFLPQRALVGSPAAGAVAASMDWRVGARFAQLAGLALIIVGSFGPWLRSGDRLRTSYELFQVADRLGVLGDGPLRWLPRAWVCLPLVAATAVFFHAAAWHRAGAVCVSIVAAGTLAIGGAVVTSPLHLEWGTVAGLAGAAASVAAVLVAAVPVASRDRSPNQGVPRS